MYALEKGHRYTWKFPGRQIQLSSRSVYKPNCMHVLKIQIPSQIANICDNML